MAATERREAVVDASAVVEALLRGELGTAVRARMRATALHAPAHMDAEVLSGLVRLQRAGKLAPGAAQAALRELQHAPIQRHPLPDLLGEAWAAREQFRLVDALYVALARALGSLVLLTTDARLAASCGLAELVEAPR